MQTQVKLNPDSSIKDPLLEKMLNLSVKVVNDVSKKISAIDGSPFNYIERSATGMQGKIKSYYRFALIENSRLFEKANIISSETWGKLPTNNPDLTYSRRDKEEYDFHIIACSMVFHPSHPMIPSMHMNYLLSVNDDGSYTYFGGGDLTPSYIFDEDCRHFHQHYKDLCQKHLGEGWHKRFKKGADNYFDLKHRGHRRGIGGTFFKNFNENGVDGEQFPTNHNKESIFKYVNACCENINYAYSTLVEKRQHHSFTEEQLHFMRLIRSRYSEFNLMYDKGVRFGIDVGIPADIPLMCMPNSDWEYDWDNKYPEGTEEYKTLDILRHPRDWV